MPLQPRQRGARASRANLLVEVVDDMRLVANHIAQSICRVRVDEAVSDPFTCLDTGNHQRDHQPGKPLTFRRSQQ